MPLKPTPGAVRGRPLRLVVWMTAEPWRTGIGRREFSGRQALLHYAPLAITILWPLLFPLHISGHYFSLASTFLEPLPLSGPYLLRVST
jgi:hypothetical protein